MLSVTDGCQWRCGDGIIVPQRVIDSMCLFPMQAETSCNGCDKVARRANQQKSVQPFG
jgi:hypothetical protein